MSDARKIIADTVIAELHSVLGDAKCQLRMTELGADAIIAALKAAGLVIVKESEVVAVDVAVANRVLKRVWP